MEEKTKVLEFKQGMLASHPHLLEILELNGEQLTYYFEDRLIENPFIEFDYPIEKRVRNISRAVNEAEAIQSNERQEGPSIAQDLETFVYEQIMLFRQTPIRDMMVELVDELDGRGYLPQTYQELANKLNVDPILVLDAITLLQQLEPAGLGAYNLQHCLMLQTEQDPYAPEASYQLLKDYFSELNRGDYELIAQQTGLSNSEIQACLNYYKTLRSEPATLFERTQHDQRVADILIEQENDNFNLRFNQQYYPRLLFNQTYYDQMAARDDDELTAYIQEHKAMYDEVAECLRVREALIFAVTRVILNQQLAFFKGIENHPQPLLLKEIANALNLPTSVIRLVVMNKNLKFNDLVYGFNDFINVSGKVGRSGLSALNIQANIQEILQKADGPMTDEQIVDQLSQQQIMISPQLVGRYRKNKLQTSEDEIQ